MATVFPKINIICQLYLFYVVYVQATVYTPTSVDNEACTIPFLYKGKVYHDCTSEGQSRPGCFVDKDLKKWAFCKPPPKEFANCHLGSPNISFAEVKEILDTHNSFRGKMPAVRMRKLTWNSELAQLAQAAADSCKHDHVDFNLCGKRAPIGQNLYYSYNDNDYPDSMPWSFIINQWSGEQPLYDTKNKKCFESRVCGHFTQVAWDTSYLVGCGKGFCHGELMGKKQYSIQYYCSYYQSGNIANRSPFSETTGKKCQDCYLFDNANKFRCDEDQLCEICQKDTKGCIGTKEMNDAIEKNLVCADIDGNCHLNKGICGAVKAGSKLPPLLAYVKKCQKTCGICK